MNVMRISGRKFLWIVGILFALVDFRASAQVLYNYVRITNPDLIRAGSLGSDLGAPSLNENGRVAFGAFPGIFSGDGSETQLSDYTAMVVPPAAKPIFYGSYVGSRVIFSGTVNAQQGVFNSDGATIETIVIDPTIRNLFSERPLMNSTRQYVYSGGDFNSGKGGLYIAQNGTSNAVYTIPNDLGTRGLQFRGAFESDALPVQIDDSSDVFFEGTFVCRQSNPPQANDCTDELDGFIKGSTGNPPTLLVKDGTVNAAGDFVSIDASWVSHSGLLAYVGSTSDDTGIYYRLVRANNPVTDTRSGPFESFGAVAINNGGSIVFFAEFRDAAGKHNEGLFNGPDLVRNKIIARGDPLFDSTVVSFAWHPVGFNDAGQVAFLVNLATAKTLIVRADPVDGSTRVEWIGPGSGPTPASGPATVPTNWKPLNGDPPRVPTQSGAISDTALLDRQEQYSIDLGVLRTGRLLVKEGNVTFPNGDLDLNAISYEAPSVVIDNARLTLEQSVFLTCHHALIGESRAARVDVPGGDWRCSGSLRIGGAGEGILTIDSNGEITTAEGRIGGMGGGHVNIGEGGLWTADSLAIGIDHGSGDLTIQDGGTLTNDVAVIGQESGVGNRVLVHGGGGSGPSRWVTIDLTVGAHGSGELTVENGAVVLADRHFVIASEPGASGAVTVRGVNASGVPSEISVSDLSLGEEGDGKLTIEDGGLVSVFEGLDTGKFRGHGQLNVRGVSGSIFPSKLIVNADLAVGDLAAASMLIEGRAEVVSKGGSVSSPNPGIASEVSIIGDLASWKVESAPGQGEGGGHLEVGHEGDTTEGQAIVTLGGGFLSADFVNVGERGVIRGFGTVFNAGETVNHGTIVAGLTNFFNVASPMVPRADGFLKAAGVNNGAISPSVSSGTLTIQGKYTQGPQGRLLIQVGGTNPEAHGHLILAKGATLDGTLELRFINGFAPKRGDAFDFLHVGGRLSGGFVAVETKNLAPDFQFNVSTNGTNISMVALNDGTFVTPLQGQISSSNIVTAGGVSYLPYTLHVTNDCSIVELTGALRREGQDLFQTLSERSDPACEERSANVSRVLPLGALPPGDYKFHFLLDGVAVHDVSFTVPADTGELLKISRVSSGELKLEISGLAGVLYTIQASADLKTWSTLPARVGTLSGPYSVLESFSSARAQFYRVKIE